MGRVAGAAFLAAAVAAVAILRVGVGLSGFVGKEVQAFFFDDGVPKGAALAEQGN